MTDTPDRRAFLKAAAATGALGAVGAPAAEPQTSAALNQRADALFLRDAERGGAAADQGALSAAVGPDPQITSKIDYEAWGKITYNTDYALYAADKERFPVEFFHLGMFFKKAVRIHKVDERRGPRDPLRSRAISTCPRIRSRTTLARRGFRGLSLAGAEERPAGLEKERLGGVSRSLLFSRHRRIAPIRHVGARNSARHLGRGSLRGISRLLAHLYRPGDRGRRRAARAARRPAYRRRLSLPDDARQGRRHGHRLQAFLARRFRALRHSAADLDVLVFGNQEADGDRLAPGGP